MLYLAERQRQICRWHGKARCADCEKSNRHKDICCGAHHKWGDGSEVAACLQHYMTRCGKCRTAEQCCQRGHHHPKRCPKPRKPRGAVVRTRPTTVLPTKPVSDRHHAQQNTIDQEEQTTAA
eukprot:TRINITY_DN1077_c0_g2_i3.p2 TRINITY_DN1077_c0_g2~~TRINITY_DN1077_c0_g2_i3.p2  ORF type:complete len:122 (+),score=6.33 TRINITY_DN1077_c0_g2_i3:422-787(+)